MALTAGFNFTNTTPHATTTAIVPIELGDKSGYTRKGESATKWQGDNRTCPTGGSEFLAFTCVPIKDVQTDQKLYNLGKVKNGVKYTVRLDEVLVVTDTADPNYRVDEPIVAELSIKHTMSGNVTASHIATIFNRLIGACMKHDGSLRFNDLMRNGLQPDVD